MSARRALVVAVHDGFYGCGTGAGTSNRAFLQVLGDLIAPSVQLTVMPVRIDPGSAEYDASGHSEMLSLVKRAGGDVVPVDNGTSGRTRYGGLGNFRRASASAAAEITRILSQADPGLAVAFDVPFFGVGSLLAPEHAARTVIVARSTAALHAPGDRERVQWERTGLQAAVRSGGRVAATSPHIRRHLADAYGLPAEAAASLFNGLTPAEQHPGQVPHDSAHLLPRQAASGFLLSYGRAEPYKGFDDLLDALLLLRDTGVPVPHTVLGAVTDGPPLTAYQWHLAGRITAQRLDVTLRTAFTPGFRSLLDHPGLAAVVVPSRAEPFGRIPLEAYAAGASPVVATTAGGLAEIVTEDETGYTAAPADPGSLASAIGRALTASPAQRQRLLAAGRQLTRDRYDCQANVAAFLAATAPWALYGGQST